jgi:hypothetical protein
MMNRSISVLTFLACIAAISSCDTKDENVLPTISFDSPTSAGNPYMSGSPIHIHINYADDEELHEVTLSVVRDLDTTEVYHFHGHPDMATFTLEVDTMFNTMDHSDFILTATATDHEAEQTTVVETIHMHPM